MNIRIKGQPAYVRWQNRDIRDRYFLAAFRVGLVLETVKLSHDEKHYVINRGPLAEALRRVAREAEMLVIESAWDRDGLKPRDNVLLPVSCAELVPDEPTEKET